MDQKYFNEIDPIFQAAVKLQGKKRSDYLDRACRGKAELRNEVESLLEADANSLGWGKVAVWDLLKVEGVIPPEWSAALNECEAGHRFDASLYRTCPQCGVSDVVLKVNDFERQPHVEAGFVGAQQEEAPAEKSRVDPVAGWLVCVQGADYGKDYPIRTGRNYIGRAAKMDIRIVGDRAVSEENHAVMTYEPRSNSFWLAPGTGRGITYLNGAVLEMPTGIFAHDTVEVGNTLLRFVPFCSEAFRWVQT